MTLRVVVADDHTLVRESVIKTLTSESDLEVVADVADGPSTIEAVNTYAPDLLVIDIAMPGADGISVVEQLRRRRPDLRVLFLSMHDDDDSLQRAMALGAVGFVSKSSSIEELRDAIAAVRAGRGYLSTDLASRVMDLAAGHGATPTSRLTAREREILELLATGLRPGEIADELFLSVKTVKNHLTSIYHKLEVSTGAQAVAEAFRRGMVGRP